MKSCWKTVASLLAMVAVPVNAATEIAPVNSGRKGSTVVAPLNDSYNDIVNAANVAQGVAARTATITDLDTLPIPISIPAYAPPLASTTGLSAVSPVALATKTNLLPYLAGAGLLLIPLFGGFGGGGSSDFLGTQPGGNLGMQPGGNTGGTPAGPEETPGTPLVPTAPDMPSVPNEPGVPGVPTAPDVPGVPDMPNVPIVPVAPAVPEPATWLMILLGFAALGSATRARKTRNKAGWARMPLPQGA